MADPISITGLREFNRALKGLDSKLPTGVRLALNEAADYVIDRAVPKVPKRSGRAARSLKARSTRTQSRVSGGSSRAPYYPWLDFGGRVGRKHATSRPFLKDGRYLYATYFEHRDQFVQIMTDALQDVAAGAGLEVR